MTGYELTRNWYNFKFNNPTRCRSIHSDLYFYIVDLWNRVGQKKDFGLPTSIALELMNVSYNTYKKTLDDLIEFGFIILVKDSRNQHSSKVIALSKIAKATNKALDKATIKAVDKPIDTIIEQSNKEQSNNRKSFVAPTFEEVENHVVSKGFTKGYAKHVFDYYNDADWFDSKGNKVKNWRQKLNAVWLSDEKKTAANTQINSIAKTINTDDEIERSRQLYKNRAIGANVGQNTTTSD